MSAALVLLTGILLLGVCLVAPGVLTARLLDDGDPLYRWTVGLAVGVFAVPFLAFLVAWGLHTNLRPTTLLAVGLGLDAVLGLLLWRAKRSDGQASP